MLARGARIQMRAYYYTLCIITCCVTMATITDGRTYVWDTIGWYLNSPNPHIQLSSIANHTLPFWPSAKKAVDGKNKNFKVIMI